MPAKERRLFKRKIHQYEESALRKALDAIRNDHMAIREACRKFGVPKTSVIDRLKGRVPDGPRKMGPKTILTGNEESKLVQWLLKTAKSGFPRKRSDLLNTVAKIIKAQNRVSPFTNGRPGNKWYRAFLKRHPELHERTPEGLNLARAIVTEEYIRKWFTELKNFLQENNALEILFDPSRILNGDETSFSLCPKTGKVIGPKGWKNVYDVKHGNEKETLTVLLVFSANGCYLAPMVVFPYVRPPQEIVQSMPKSWFLGRSDSGWMKSETFFEYVVNSVVKWIDERKVKKPVLFLVDGHKSHLTMELSEECDKNGIILYALPPNTTHILQPADVGVFKSLKSDWKKTVWNWQNRSENVNQVLTKSTFCPLLSDVLKTAATPSTIANGFRKCGLFPFNPDAVDFSKCIQNSLENMSKDVSEIGLGHDHEVSRGTQEFFTRNQYNLANIVVTHLQKNLESKGVDVRLVLQEIQIAASTEDSANKSSSEHQNEVKNKAAVSLSDIADATDINTDLVDLDLCPGTYTVDDDGILEMTNLSFPDIEPFLNSSGSSEPVLTSTPERPPSLLTTESSHSSSNNEPSNTNSRTTDIINSNIISSTNNINSDTPPTSTNIVHTETTQTPNININSITTPASNNNVNQDATSTNNVTLLNSSVAPMASDCFEKHCYWPNPIKSNSKRKAKERPPSAISSEAWRNFYKKKNEEKEKMEAEKNKRKEEREKNGREKTLKKTKKPRKKNDQSIVNILSNETEMIESPEGKKRCARCDEEMHSDTEIEGLKNIGCDACDNWFHLRCTQLAHESYDRAASMDFVCNRSKCPGEA